MMMTRTPSTLLPFFFFPSTVCWLEDHPQKFQDFPVDPDHTFHLQFCSQPEQVLDAVFRQKPLLQGLSLVKEDKQHQNYGSSHQLPFQLDISVLQKIVQMDARQQEITVLIVPQRMGFMTGLEFLERVKGTPVKKILVCDDSCPQMVLQAFNRGLVDQFLSKEQICAKRFQESLNQMHTQYFWDQSKMWLSQMESSLPSPLSDPCFVSFFHNWMLENDIQEFYLMSRQGTFLTLNSKQEKSYFVLMGASQAQDFYAQNDDCLDKVGFLLEGVVQQKTVPFFGPGNEGWEVDLSQWASHFYPAQTFVGRELYAWAVVAELT